MHDAMSGEVTSNVQLGLYTKKQMSNSETLSILFARNWELCQVNTSMTRQVDPVVKVFSSFLKKLHQITTRWPAALMRTK